VDSIKIVVREIGWGGIDRIDLAQNRISGGLLGTLMIIPVQYKEFLSTCTTGGFSRKAHLPEVR
jgi:hypothetical protein